MAPPIAEEAATFSLVEQAEDCEGLLEKETVQVGRRYRWAVAAVCATGGVAACVAASGQAWQRQAPAAIAEKTQLDAADAEPFHLGGKPSLRCIGSIADGALRKWNQVCGDDGLKLQGQQWQGSKKECREACERDPACQGVQWVEGPDPSLTRCIFQTSEITASTPYTASQPGESDAPLDPECWFKCDCKYNTRLSCPLNCESSNAADVIKNGAFQGLSNFDHAPDATSLKCKKACEDTADCTGYVTQKFEGKGGKGNIITQTQCFGVKGPTTPVDDPELQDLQGLRPLSGVQLGACGLQWPKEQDVSNKCTQAEKDAHDPWTYDQSTTFLTCRQAPWAKCGMYGDPHVATFDRPYASADCPTTPGQRHSGKQTVKEQGTYTLVRLPKPVGNVGQAFVERDLHVIGKFGYTTAHRNVASTKGVAVEGNWLAGNALVVELDVAGKILTKWGPPGNQEIILNYDPANPVTLTAQPSVRLFAELTWVKNTRLSSADKAAHPAKAQKLYPLLYFAIRDAAGQDFVRVFVQGLKVDKPVKDRLLDVIVSQQKPVRFQQDGICGNFNCNARDDALNSNQMLALQTNADHLFKVAFPYTGPASAAGPSGTIADFKQRCKENNVAKGLRQGCADDIAALTVQDDAAIQSVIHDYQVFSTAWQATR